MNTLILRWQRPTSADPLDKDMTETQVREQLTLWGFEHKALTENGVREVFRKKMQQLNEMNEQFKQGESADIQIGILRVGGNMEDRTGSWPQWLRDILAKKLDYDPINNQFFLKTPDADALSKTRTWAESLKVSPLWHFAKSHPTYAIKNILKLGSLRKALLMDVERMDVLGIDQPAPGEDGYYQFRDAGFRTEITE